LKVHSASPSDIKRARQLRAAMTDAERRLWRGLREQLPIYRFRRQAPIGPYVADFVCFEARLVIEVDGGQHAAAKDRDDQRTAWLASQNFRVVRFWDNDVLLQTDAVLEEIRQALRS
jgi:very-short-patch-repair endonuclease